MITSNINRTKNYRILIYDNENKFTRTNDFVFTGQDFVLPWVLSSLTKDVRSYRSQKKAKNFRTSVQAFTNNQYFFPTPGLFNFTCNIQKNLEEVYNCSIKKFDQQDGVNFPYRKFTFTTIAPIFSKDNSDEINGFSHGSSMHGISSNRPNKMNTNCYQEVSFTHFAFDFKMTDSYRL